MFLNVSIEVADKQLWEDQSYLSLAETDRRKKIILHSVHRSNNLLKHLFVTLLI